MTYQRRLFIFLLIYGFLCIGISETSAFSESVSYLQGLTIAMVHPADVAVAESGDIYVVDSKSSKIIAFNPSGTFRAVFGRKGSKPGQLRNPSSVAVNPMGEIVVADTGNHRVQVFNVQGEFQYEFGNYGTGRGEFKSPIAVAVDRAGYIYVLDSVQKRLQSFTPKGISIGILPLPYVPQDIGIDRLTNIYILSSQNGKIYQYDSRGKFLKEFTCRFQKRNYLAKARGIAVDDRGDIYFSETGEDSIKKIEGPDKIILSFGSDGEDQGQFRMPTGITAASDDRILVADSRNRRIQIFKILGSDKALLQNSQQPLLPVEFDSYISSSPFLIDLTATPSWGLLALSDKEGTIYHYHQDVLRYGNSRGKKNTLKNPRALSIDKNGIIYVADTRHNRIQVLSAQEPMKFKFGKKGSRTGHFSNPQGIAVNDKSMIFVADTRNGRVQVFNDSGIFLKAWNMPGKRDSDLKGYPEPRSLAVDSQGRLFVTDFINDRIEILDGNGNCQIRQGSPGVKPGQFDKPVDIAVDENDFWYVADQGNHRIQIFNPEGQFVTAFGSEGKGPSYFPHLTGVAAYGGKIYVSNYGSARIAVFKFDSSSENPIVPSPAAKPSSQNLPQQMTSSESETGQTTAPREEDVPAENVQTVSSANNPAEGRLSVTKTFILPPNFDRNNADHVYQLRLQAYAEAIKELASGLGITDNEIGPYIQIEKEEFINYDRLCVTVSAPKTIPKKNSGK